MASLQPGDQARIGRIVFEMVRSRCWEAGIAEGETVACHEKGEEGVLVAVADRPATWMDADWARFVEVTPL